MRTQSALLPGVPTLDQLAADPAKATTLDHEAAAGLLARCVTAGVAIICCLISQRPERPPDVLAPDDERQLTIRDVAARLGLSRSYVYELVRNRNLPALRIGRRVLVRLVDLRRWEEAHLSRLPRHAPPKSEAGDDGRGERASRTAARAHRMRAHRPGRGPQSADPVRPSPLPDQQIPPSATAAHARRTSISERSS